MLITKIVRALTWLLINKKNIIKPTKITFKGEYINCEKINIALEYIQHYFTVTEFPASFKLVSKCGKLNWYQNVNEKYVRCNNNIKIFRYKTNKTNEQTKHTSM